MRKTNKRVRKRTCPSGGKKAVVAGKVQRIVSERETRYGVPGEERRNTLIQAVKPVRETKTVKRSGRAQQVPKRVSESRGTARASRWVLEAAKKRAKKRACPRHEARRVELSTVYEEVRARQVMKQGGNGAEAGRKLQAEPLLMRDRRHKAAKANRVNVS
jgi:ribosomal protein S7